MKVGKVKMAKFNSFEEIIAWQKARELNSELYLITGQGKFSIDFGLRDQIRRASISITSILLKGLNGKQQKSLFPFYI